MATWPKMVKFIERTQVASDIQVMNHTTPIHGIATLGLLKYRYRKRKPKEERTTTGVISVVVISVVVISAVVISVVVIIPSVIATATGVGIVTATGVGIATATGVVTSTRMVINPVCLTRRYAAYC
jgi:Mg2+/Co2+ transporter CorB